MALSILSISFLVAYLVVSQRLNSANKVFSQLFVSYNTLKEAADNQPTKTEDDIHKENFIKFLSDSREWAFNYIEDVQKALSKFIEEVEPQLEYYKSYGAVVEGTVAPHDKALKKISKEFDELKKMLPEESDDRR